MLSKAGTLKGFKLDSLDGEIGKVKEFYFDDRHWTIRYLVADTGNWLPGRKVLISPYALVAVNKEEQNIAVNLTKKQIEDSPSLNSHKPVSHQFEQAYYGHFGWPTYWGGPDRWGYKPISINLIFRKKLPQFFQLQRSPRSSYPQGERDGAAMIEQMPQRQWWRKHHFERIDHFHQHRPATYLIEAHIPRGKKTFPPVRFGPPTRR